MGLSPVKWSYINLIFMASSVYFLLKKDADEFFTFLNSRHNNIKFTFKKEIDNKIEFLDV